MWIQVSSSDHVDAAAVYLALDQLRQSGVQLCTQSLEYLGLRRWGGGGGGGGDDDDDDDDAAAVS